MSDTEDFNFLDYSHKYQALNINGSKFLIGVCKKNGSRNIILTNLKDFYKENIFKETIVSRCQDLNPAFEEHNVEEKEYKAEGIKLLRNSMITEKFSKEVFETKLKNDKPLDKINVFLEVMNYNKTAKQIAKLEVQDVEKKDIEPKVTTKNCSKRKSSCVLRCAPPPTQLSRASNIQNTKKAEFQL
ncbi:hypothetical protein TKK_0000361 [Trichogramma kaykai]